MNDSDFILYNEWIRSPECMKAFEAWKQQKLATFQKYTMPYPFKQTATATESVSPSERAIPVQTPHKCTSSDNSGFSGPDWDRHVEKCRLSGRDPYD